MKLSRRQFIATTAVGLAASGCGLPTQTRAPIKGSILGASSAAGHRLRSSPISQSPTRVDRVKVVILGGGVAGLAAAKTLRDAGCHDFAVLELESRPGGNALSYPNEICPSPWGAHYVPIPNPDCAPILQLFNELKIIEGFSPEGLPIYNEFFLCSDPMERLFFRGRWQDGLIPQHGLSPEEKAHLHAFHEKMEYYRLGKGTDGKAAFAIPVDESSRDPELLALDRITMAEFLRQNGWSSEPLRWYVDYCCRDDYGTRLDDTSAWAGIHYFASRRGLAANAAPNSILTWPEGNGWLIQQIAQPMSEKIRTGFLATGIGQTAEKISVDGVHLAANDPIRLEADYLICAIPRFVSQHLIPHQSREIASACTYAPWMVATLFLTNPPPESAAEDFAWDNVFYGSKSLGYVVANHQWPQVVKDRFVLTYYFPLCERTPAEERAASLQRSHHDWCELILADLEPAHPRIRDVISQIDIWLWGHAMIRPTVGFISSETRRRMALADGRIHFAHSDMSGISIFEEAYIRGCNAGAQVLSQLGHV